MPLFPTSVSETLIYSSDLNSYILQESSEEQDGSRYRGGCKRDFHAWLQLILRTPLRHWNELGLERFFYFIIGHSLFDIGYSLSVMRRPGSGNLPLIGVFLLTCHNENC